MRTKLRVLAPFVIFALVAQAQGESILYTEFATGSGTFGSSVFANAEIVVSVLADTKDVGGNGIVWDVIGLSATVTVQGLGTATITD